MSQYFNMYDILKKKTKQFIYNKYYATRILIKSNIES